MAAISESATGATSSAERAFYGRADDDLACRDDGHGGRTAGPIARWRPYVEEASLRFGVPVSWIDQVMRAESGGLTTVGNGPIRSRAGAMGLMQLMPATWADIRARLTLGTDPDDPRDNILAGTLFLRLMYDRFGYPGLFGAYNAGPERYANVLVGRARLPRETIAYMRATEGPSCAVQPTPAPTPQGLFVVRNEPFPAPSPTISAQPQATLFAIQKPVP
jgi:soluble lytic murein transglycosylase-like protein